MSPAVEAEAQIEGKQYSGPIQHKTAVADLFRIGIALTMLEIESHTHFQSAFARVSSADICIPMFLFQIK
ncbi:hypothetical protein [Xylella fastidiosa]|uniref:hypothetical protein n=1 Tax=Xylella fastidiosa TaxID=2371 RepID=UPI000A661C15|nr:hypothetical protein [Xylella fastidiosa]